MLYKQFGHSKSILKFNFNLYFNFIFNSKQVVKDSSWTPQQDQTFIKKLAVTTELTMYECSIFPSEVLL